MINFIKALGNLPNTFWGILVLFSSMWIAVHYNSNIGFYFAGIGSTLLGIQHSHGGDLPNTTTTINSNPPIKVESNASDTTSQN